MRISWGAGALVVAGVAMGCGGEARRRGTSAEHGGSAGSVPAGAGSSGAGRGGTAGPGGNGGTGGGGGLRVNERGTIDHGYVPPDACAFFMNPGCTGEGVSCRDINVNGSVRSCTYWGFSRGSCDPGRPGDECCETSDCSTGECLWALPVQLERVCGEPVSDGHNVCVANECETDADCPGGICTSSSTFGVQRCMPAACASDADCTERSGGACRHIYGGCCRLGEPGSGGCEVCQLELPGPFRSSAVACIYPGDGCRYDDDCPTGSKCTVVGGVAACRIECTANDF